MKKSIIFGSLLAVFLLLMIPNVSAVEYTQVEEINLVNEQFKEENIIPLINKQATIENINNLFDEMVNKVYENKDTDICPL